MLSKSFIAYAFLFCFTTSVNAHAIVNEALGVTGNATRNDVQRPSAANPCGNVNIAQSLDTSTPVPANANGSFSPTITDFNGGADGSREIKTVQVDASGTGKNFVAANMVVNGDPNPSTVGTQSLTVQLPPNTKCAGGTSKNLCLASFTTTAGFGNCVVVSQGAQGSQDANNEAVPSATPSGVAKGRPQANASNKKTDAKSSGNDNQKGDKTGSKAMNTRRSAKFRRSWSSHY